MERTLSCRIDHLHETHAVVDHELLAICIFYRRIVRLTRYGYFATHDAEWKHTSVVWNVHGRSCSARAWDTGNIKAYRRNN